MKKAILWINIILISAVVFSGCSSKKDDPKPSDIKEVHMKFNLTITGIQAEDDFQMVVSGGDVAGAATTLFKLNGETQTNKRGFIITKQQIVNGKITLETVIPIYSLTLGIGGASGTANHTFAIKMESSVGGKDQPVLNKTVTTTAYSETFTYSPDSAK